MRYRVSKNNTFPVQILLAEDNPADVYLIRQALAENNVNCSIDVACNGKQALSFLSEDGESQSKTTPNLILLDINLPQHKGTEILQHIRQSRRFSSVPVIVFTSSDSPADRLSATQLGAVRYIKKPSLLDEFMAIGGVIREVLMTQPVAAAET
jgi:two-component system, chemotaxis family, response regulator Rcp1